jgi:hypothetical protein
MGTHGKKYLSELMMIYMMYYGIDGKTESKRNLLA